jgi:hypothetical protein
MERAFVPTGGAAIGGWAIATRRRVHRVAAPV